MSMTIGSSYTQTLLSLQTSAKTRAAKTEAAPAAEETGKKEQTLAEFKQEFKSWISSLPVHPSQASAHQSVSIDDRAFEKMMEDPEFKAKIEDQIRKDLSANFSPANPAFTTMRFDKDGEYSGSAGGSAHMGSYEAESRDSFWKKEPKTASSSEKRRQENERYLEKLAERRRLEKADLRNQYFDRLNVGSYQAGSTGTAASLFTDAPLA